MSEYERNFAKHPKEKAFGVFGEIAFLHKLHNAKLELLAIITKYIE